MNSISRERSAVFSTPAVAADPLYGSMVLLFCTFAFRDALSGMGRFYLAHIGLGALWFVPELMTIPVFGLYIWRWAIQRRSVFAIILSVNTLTALAVSIIYMAKTPFQIISAFKMFLPLFAGMMFAGHSVTERSWARWTLGTTFAVSLIGLILSAYVKFPWVGQSIDNFGQVRLLTRVWWIGDKARYSGFATDSTMAALMTVLTYLLVYRSFSVRINAVLIGLTFYALYLSTSRTVLLVFGLFTVYYLAVEILGPKNRTLAITRGISRWSFLCLAAPPVLISAFSRVDLTRLSPLLLSMQDRIDNSWQLPFTHLAEQFPTGLIFGCGLGCYAYPMQYTDLAVQFVPVDNFYLISYLMLGLPFLLTLTGWFMSVARTNDRGKLLMIAVLNVILTTVAGYGPSFSTLLVGYAFSDMVLTAPRRWTRRSSAGRDPTAAGQGLDDAAAMIPLGRTLPQSAR